MPTAGQLHNTKPFFGEHVSNSFALYTEAVWPKPAINDDLELQLAVPATPETPPCFANALRRIRQNFPTAQVRCKAT